MRHVGDFTSLNSSAVEDSEVGDKTDAERTGFHRMKVFVIHTSGRFARQSGRVEVVDRMSAGVQQIETLQYYPYLFVDLETDLAIKRHGIVRMNAVILGQGTLAEIAELHAAEKRTDIVYRDRRLAYPLNRARNIIPGRV